MKHVVGLLSDIVNNGLGPAYFVSAFGTLVSIGRFGSVFLLSNCCLAGSERDLPYQVELYPRDERRLGATPYSQGPTPGVVGEAPQGLQGAFGARGGEEGEGGRSG